MGPWRDKAKPSLTGGLRWGKEGLKVFGVFLGTESFQTKNWEEVKEKVCARLRLNGNDCTTVVVQGKGSGCQKFGRLNSLAQINCSNTTKRSGGGCSKSHIGLFLVREALGQGSHPLSICS